MIRHVVRAIASGWLIGKAFDGTAPTQVNAALCFFFGFMVGVYTAFDLYDIVEAKWRGLD